MENITEKGKAYVWYLILDVLLLIQKKKLLSPHHLVAMLLSPPWISFPLVTHMLLCCFHHHCTLVYVTRTIHVISFTSTNWLSHIIGIIATIISAAVAVNTMANTVIGTHHHHCRRCNCHQHHHYLHNNSGSLNIVDCAIFIFACSFISYLWKNFHLGMVCFSWTHPLCFCFFFFKYIY